MNRSIVIFGACVTILALTLTACGNEPTPAGEGGGTVNVSATADSRAACQRQ